METEIIKKVKSSAIQEQLAEWYMVNYPYSHNVFSKNYNVILDYIKDTAERDVALSGGWFIAEKGGKINSAFLLSNYGMGDNGKHTIWRIRHLWASDEESFSKMLDEVKKQINKVSTESAKIFVHITDKEKELKQLLKKNNFEIEASLKDYYRLGETIQIFSRLMPLNTKQKNQIGHTVEKSTELWKRAEKIILNGTHLYSKSQYYNVAGISPAFFTRGKGSHAWDLDNNEYIDYSMGIGPVVLGYSYPKVNEAIKAQLEKGTTFSASSPIEVEVAELIGKIIPCAEKLRFLKTGSSATSAAVRIARAYTKKEIILRGGYHGWHDWCIANTKSNAGIPDALNQKVFEGKYNDLESYKTFFEDYKDQIAAVILEPVEFDEPKNNFLKKLKTLAHNNGALLIFDEIVSGFRTSLGGAQEHYNVTPDIATFGKAIANGMPLSVVTGKSEIFDEVSNKIFISSTFGGETLSLAAAKATITEFMEKPVIKTIWNNGKKLKDGTNKIAQENGINMECVGLPCRLKMKWQNNDYKSSIELKTLFIQEATKRGVFIGGWSLLPSFSHSKQDIEKTLEVFDDVSKVYKKAITCGNIKRYLKGGIAHNVL